MAAEEATVDLPEDPAALPVCDHHWIGHLKGDEPLSVRICSLCGEPDWDDLRRQIADQADGIAYGLFVLEAPIFGDHRKRWEELTQLRRDIFRARARFALSAGGLVG